MKTLGALLSLGLLAGCASAPAGPAPLLVGSAARDLTPPMGYGMSGYYHERGADGVRDPLQAKALVLRQGDVAAALVVADLIGISSDLCAEVRGLAAAATGIPPHAIAVAATHTHTAPTYQADLSAWIESGRPSGGYPEKLVKNLAGAVIDAHAALRPDPLRVVRAVQDPEVSFNRRFVMKDGSIKTWASYTDPNVVRAAGPIDPQVDVILAGERAALVNFALHLDTLGGTKWSADFPHDLGEALKPDLGAGLLTIFANGCCGDINHSNPRAKERNKTDVIGKAIAASIRKALPSAAPMGPGALAVRSTTVRAPLQEFSSDDLARAREIIARDRKGEKLPFLEEVWAYKVEKVEILRNGPKRAGRRLAGIGNALPLEVQAFRIDRETAIVTLPGEVFVDLGLAIKKGSPFPRTLVVELSNASETIYIPTRDQYAGGGYEPTNSTLKPGGGELLVEAALGLLRDLASGP